MLGRNECSMLTPAHTDGGAPSGTVRVSGSWGSLDVCPRTGCIVRANHSPMTREDAIKGNTGYRDILFFDPVPFAREWLPEYDILSCGYWLGHDGIYVEPLAPRMVTDAHGVTEPDDYWVEVRLLPAPRESRDGL